MVDALEVALLPSPTRWRDQLGTAMFEWIEGFYNPTRRHSALGYLSPADHETANTPGAIAA